MKLESRRTDATIATSPMADIAFLLVIYFMLTTTFSITPGLDFRTEAEREDPPLIDPVESVLVEVNRDGALRVDSKPPALGELLEYLRPRLERNPGKPVILKTDPGAPYGAMIDVLDELRQGGERLGLPEGIRVAVPTEREQQRYWL